MKFTVSVFLVALVACAVQGRSLDDWESKTKALEAKFENFVNQRAQAAKSDVQTAANNLKSNAAAFIKGLETEIETSVSNAIKDLEILEDPSTLECVKNATIQLYNAEQAALANLVGCQNLSLAYQDIEGIDAKAVIIVNDVASDVKDALAGLSTCKSEIGINKFKCAAKYIAIEIQQLVSQWPDVKNFLDTTKTLGIDVVRQINACVTSPSQKSLDDNIKQALEDFALCIPKPSLL